MMSTAVLIRIAAVGAIAAGVGVYFLRYQPDQAIVEPPATDTGQTAQTESVAAPPPEPTPVAPTAQATPSTPDPQMDAALPRLGLVRVEASGAAVVAGTGPAASDVVLRLDGQEVAVTRTDGQGNFVSLFDMSITDAPRILTVEAVETGGEVRRAVESVIVAPTFPRGPAVGAMPTSATDPVLRGGVPVVVSLPDDVQADVTASDAGEVPAAQTLPEAPEAPAIGPLVSDISVAALSPGAAPPPVAAPSPVVGPDRMETRAPSAALSPATRPAPVATTLPAAAPEQVAAPAAIASTPVVTVPVVIPAPAIDSPQIAAQADAPAQPLLPDETLASIDATPQDAPQAATEQQAPLAVPPEAPVNDTQLASAEQPRSEEAPVVGVIGEPLVQAGQMPSALVADGILSRPDLAQAIPRGLPVAPDARTGSGQPVTAVPERPLADVATAVAGGTENLPTTPVAPRLFRVGPAGVAVVNEGPGDKPQAKIDLGIDIIAYDDLGDVQLSGSGRRASELRIYLDNRPVQTVLVDDVGAWTSPLPNVDSGIYTLRIDEVTSDGSVVSRVETPFQRTAPEIAAQLRRDGATAITVQPGYTLWAISEGYFGNGVQYVQLFEANRDLIRDPDLIYPGQVFALPKDQTAN